jgi:hypothetical protein
MAGTRSCQERPREVSAPSLKNETGSKAERVDRQVAKQFNVSEGYVYAAKKLKDKSPKIFEMVKAGTVSISEAQKQLGMKQTVKRLMPKQKPKRVWPGLIEFVELSKSGCN